MKYYTLTSCISIADVTCVCFVDVVGIAECNLDLQELEERLYLQANPQLDRGAMRLREGTASLSVVLSCFIYFVSV